MYGLQIFFLLQLLWCLANASPANFDLRRGCAMQTCHPRPGNLVVGRKVTTTTECGRKKREKYCVVEACGDINCINCNSRKANKAHPPSQMTDSFLSHPATWWQSSLGASPEIIQLDLEGHFYFTHLVMVFKSSRPAAMTIERSDNFGQSWRPYSYYAANCTEEFGLVEGEEVDEGAVCTSRYSSPEPCTKGEVIFRSLLPTRGSFDPYSLEAQERLKITNLRINLLKSQQCPCVNQNPSMAAEMPKLDYFAVYDLIVGGTCFCNGHASECVPMSVKEGERDDTATNKVHGKCVCQHNTDGDNCEKCLPLYSDAPWRPANALTNEANGCIQCKCNGHADSCHFDSDTWLESGRTSGGVCDDCKHNTQGRNCEQCKPGYFRSPSKDLADPDVCIRCQCSAVGASDRDCDPDIGACFCKEGVAEPFCDKCLPGYYAFGGNGCKKCSCEEGVNCDPNSGACIPPIIEWKAKNEQVKRRKERKNKERRRHQLQLAMGLRKFENCFCHDKSVIGADEDLCRYDYVVRAKILWAEDKGSNVVVTANIKRTFKNAEATTVDGAGEIQLYPTSWTKTGCTCPVLLQGEEYVIAGIQDVRTSRYLVDQRSLVVPWERDVGRKVSNLMGRCP